VVNVTTEQALALLVHSARARERWRAGELVLEPGVEADLATLDHATIESSAATVRRHVLARHHAGIGTIADAFPRTIAAWRARHGADHDLDELATKLLDSDAATEWRETAGHSDGISLEETFYRFAEAEQLGDADVREAEWLATAVRMLALDHDPAYLIPANIHRHPGVVWALDHRTPPTLYAAVSGKILIGPVTPLVGELLAGATPEAVEGGVTAEAAHLVRRRLCELGLLG
jgi:hypothetical protein